MKRNRQGEINRLSTSSHPSPALGERPDGTVVSPAERFGRKTGATSVEGGSIPRCELVGEHLRGLQVVEDAFDAIGRRSQQLEDEIQCIMQRIPANEIVEFNVGGEIFAVDGALLHKIPGSLLHMLAVQQYEERKAVEREAVLVLHSSSGKRNSSVPPTPSSHVRAAPSAHDTQPPVSTAGSSRAAHGDEAPGAAICSSPALPSADRGVAFAQATPNAVQPRLQLPETPTLPGHSKKARRSRSSPSPTGSLIVDARGELPVDREGRIRIDRDPVIFRIIINMLRGHRPDMMLEGSGVNLHQNLLEDLAYFDISVNDTLPPHRQMIMKEGEFVGGGAMECGKCFDSRGPLFSTLVGEFQTSGIHAVRFEIRNEGYVGIGIVSRHFLEISRTDADFRDIADCAVYFSDGAICTNRNNIHRREDSGQVYEAEDIITCEMNFKHNRVAWYKGNTAVSMHPLDATNLCFAVIGRRALVRIQGISSQIEE